MDILNKVKGRFGDKRVCEVRLMFYRIGCDLIVK